MNIHAGVTFETYATIDGASDRSSSLRPIAKCGS
jgi:hypothetical protein